MIRLLKATLGDATRIRMYPKFRSLNALPHSIFFSPCNPSGGSRCTPTVVAYLNLFEYEQVLGNGFAQVRGNHGGDEIGTRFEPVHLEPGKSPVSCRVMASRRPWIGEAPMHPPESAKVFIWRSQIDCNLKCHYAITPGIGKDRQKRQRRPMSEDDCTG